jgi:glutamate-ammonia-ligase adenylyltransferase
MADCAAGKSARLQRWRRCNMLPASSDRQPAASLRRSAMQLDVFSRFYRRHAGRLDDVAAAWAGGVPSRAEIDAAVRARRAGVELGAALRQVRNALMLRLIECDVLHEATLEQVCVAVSDLAEVSLAHGIAEVEAELEPRHGRARAADGTPARFFVVGMGKLGGAELNVSSDIDLVFMYDADGRSDGAVPLGNAEYFGLVARRLVALLSELTADGFVFRVDTRLRPNGESGPPVVSLAMLEEYFQVQGREWERFAWLKSRVVAPVDAALQQALDQVVEPFVWRRYLDFAMLEALRGLHRQIRAEAVKRANARPDRANDVKLGRGGIREIEFIVQLLQIVRGGRQPQVRARNTLQALPRLAQAGLLDAETAQRLADGYRFLRRLEHRIQYQDDAQTHCLPSDDADFEQLALSLGDALVQAQPQARRPACALSRELDAVREFVAGEFDALLHAGPRCVGCRKPADSIDALRQALAGIDGDAAQARLQALQTSPRYAALSESGRQRMLRVVERSIALVADDPGADRTLARLFDMLEAIARRETYLAFFAEQPQALARLLSLLGASGWAAGYITRNPMVVDELVVDAGRERFDAQACLDDCAAQRARLQQRGTWDAGEGLDILRRAFHAEMFRTLARDLAGRLGVEQVADELSALADTVIGQALRWCWDELPQRHREQPAFAVIAYGKLGGKELGYGGDLDLVFLFDDAAADARERYVALARKLIWWLTAVTPAGTLFEIDTRLRPNGNAGLLVTTLPAFAGYQLGRGDNAAWTWEHQALTRARFCAGDAGVGAQFERVRAEVLRMPRDAAALHDEILAMRERVAAGHPNPGPLFDLKHDPGGMVDVEFAVQALVLAHASAHVELVDNVGNIALLQRAETLGLLPTGVGEAAAQAYRELRRRQHLARLDDAHGAARVDAATVAAQRAAVHALKLAVFGAERVTMPA